MYVLDAENFKEARITLTLIFINIFSFIAFNIILPFEYIFLLVQMNSKVINEQEYWRLFTAMFLHADVFHIFSNLIALLLFGAAVEKNYTKMQYLVIYFVSGLIGNIFSLFLLPLNAISLGASGAIFGLIGASFILFVLDGEKFLLLIGLFYLVYFIISSLAPGINLWAHLFGLVGGITFGYIFMRSRRIREDYRDYY